MPTNSTHQHQVTQSSSSSSCSSSSSMAVAVDHHHQPHGFKPWKRRSRLHSFPHIGVFYDFTSPPPPQPPPLPQTPSLPRRRHFNRSFSTPCFSYNDQNHRQEQAQEECIDLVGSYRATRGTQALVVETATTLASAFCCIAVPASSGLGGAYFLRKKSGEYFAVIKPISNDPLALSHFSVYAGETSLREVAAYLLDHGGFSGVPPTALINIPHHHSALHDTITCSTISTAAGSSKIASIQRFVPHDFDAGDIGPSKFSVESVHRIGILDVRLLNIDRHAGNILVKKKYLTNTNYDQSSSMAEELVPIDHGLCLPEVLDAPYFEWLHWPQSVVPFSEQELEYISLLDPYKDVELLHAKLPSLKEAAIRIMIVCTIFLKQAAIEGLCLADIGGMMTREFSGLEEGGPSELETLCKEAIDAINFRSSSSKDEGEEKDSHDETTIFQFEMDSDVADARFIETDSGGEVMDIPLLVRSNKRSNEEENNTSFGALSKEGGGGGGGGGGGILLFRNEVDEEPISGNILGKSMSMTAAADLIYHESSGGSSSNINKAMISFGGMSEEEWGEFLERFQQVVLLPEAFEKRKGGMSMNLNPRLGSSCKF